MEGAFVRAILWALQIDARADAHIEEHPVEQAFCHRSQIEAMHPWVQVCVAEVRPHGEVAHDPSRIARSVVGPALNPSGIAVEVADGPDGVHRVVVKQPDIASQRGSRQTQGEQA